MRTRAQAAHLRTGAQAGEPRHGGAPGVGCSSGGACQGPMPGGMVLLLRGGGAWTKLGLQLGRGSGVGRVLGVEVGGLQRVLREEEGGGGGGGSCLALRRDLPRGRGERRHPARQLRRCGLCVCVELLGRARRRRRPCPSGMHSSRRSGLQATAPRWPPTRHCLRTEVLLGPRGALTSLAQPLLLPILALPQLLLLLLLLVGTLLLVPLALSLAEGQRQPRAWVLVRAQVQGRDDLARVQHVQGDRAGAEARPCLMCRALGGSGEGPAGAVGGLAGHSCGHARERVHVFLQVVWGASMCVPCMHSIQRAVVFNATALLPQKCVCVCVQEYGRNRGFLAVHEPKIFSPACT